MIRTNFVDYISSYQPVNM